MMKRVLQHWQHMPPRWLEITLALAMPLTLTGLFLSGEILLRWEQYRQFGDAAVVETKVNQKIWEKVGKRRRPLPNARLGKVHFSDDGFRGEKLVQPKPPHVIRVGFFGSSTTLDFYVTDDTKTWPAVASQQLSAAFPGCSFDFFNAGVLGYNIKATQLRFAQDAAPFQSDIAVFLLNDVSSRVISHLSDAGHDIDVYRPSGFAQSSILWQKLEKNAEARRLQRLAMRPDIALRVNLDKLRSDAHKDLDDFSQAVKAGLALPVLVENATRMRREQSPEQQVDVAKSRLLYMPGIFISDVVDALYVYNEVLRAVAADHALPYIETLAEMPGDASYYVDTSHTSIEGSRVFGEIVGRKLVADPRVRALVAERGARCLSP